ncbi:MAG TPA: hypothetical protein VK636_14735 [Gemmatimonadaceae bacterium]|nr:hypothetical protein [Gemmatimonadaceae bacterium]
MKFLAVRNYDKFQHYRDRNPPWIKLYTALLDDYAFLQLPDRLQIQLVLIWLLASRHDNRIPYDELYVRAAIKAKQRVNIPALLDTGFIVVIEEQDASSVASKDASGLASTGASNLQASRAPARSREGEAETETETDSSSPPAAAEIELAARFPASIDRDALTALLRIAPSRATWRAEITASLDGMAGHATLTPAQCGEAIRDFLGNGAAANPNLNHFRGYLRNAGKLREPAPPRRSRAAGGGARNDEALNNWLRKKDAEDAASIGGTNGH